MMMPMKELRGQHRTRSDHAQTDEDDSDVAAQAGVGRMRGERVALTVQGLRQGATKPIAERQDDGAEQQGEAPAPGLQGLRTGETGQDHTDQAAAQSRHRLADALKGRVESSPGGRRRLDQEGRRRAHFAPAVQ
jgi:hypothetical protein